MALLEVSTEQILKLIQQLPQDGKRFVFERLRQDMKTASSDPVLDEESKAWLEADLAGELPEYDWGPDGEPEGLPVKYDPKRGVAVVEGDNIGS